MGFTQYDGPVQLDAAVDAMPESVRADAVRALAVQVAEGLGIAIRCRASADLEALVQELDEAAWQLQEEAEERRRPFEDYYAAFRLARAANAWWDATKATDPQFARSAAYEAATALGGHPADFDAAIAFLAEWAARTDVASSTSPRRRFRFWRR